MKASDLKDDIRFTTINASLLLLQGVLELAQEIGASDISVTSGLPIAYRVSREMVKTSTEPTDTIIMQMLEELTKTNLSAINVGIGKPVDGSFMGHGGFWRFNAASSTNGIDLSIRMLMTEPPPFEKIGLDSENMKPFIEKIARIEEGLYLFAGTTGSGKTTSMVSLLHNLAMKSKIKIITLEDPIEFFFDNRNYPTSVFIQREIGRNLDDFSVGLRDAMRQNPDVIFVGEIRDKATAAAAYQAALTGHMVLATIHAGSVSRIRERMEWLMEGVADNDNYLGGAVHQKLVRDNNGKVSAIREVWVNENREEG